MNVPGTLLILASSCTTVYSDLTTLNKWINSDYESSKMLTRTAVISVCQRYKTIYSWHCHSLGLVELHYSYTMVSAR